MTTNILGVLNTANELAYLAGLFNWQVEAGSYENPDGRTTSFHVITGNDIPLLQYAKGAINTFNLLTGADKVDPNKGLFNTNIIATGLGEKIVRKYAINRVPYSNSDQPVDLGTGSQRIVFKVVFAGTMYMTAFTNVAVSLFGNKTSGLGILNHPFYGEIEGVLPVEMSSAYTSESLNCVVCEIVFMTSDISHLNPSALKESKMATAQKWYIGVQNAITSIAGTVSAAKSLASNVVNGVK